MQGVMRPRVSAMLKRSRQLLAAAAGACLLAGFAAPVCAATINVANNTDYAFGSGPSNADGLGCTFRKALANASNGNGAFTACTAGSGTADTIAFADAADFQIGTLGIFGDITTDITITAPGAKKFIGGTGLGSGGIFRVIGSTAKLTMNGFTLQDATNSAVFLNNGATLSMNVGTFSNNSQDTGGGGAINGDGVISLTGIHFTGNSAPNGSGGAIRLNNSAYGAASITDSFFDNNTANNSGGAIYYSGTSSSLPVATLTITNTQFGFLQANTAHAAGGALEGGGALFVTANGLGSQVSVINSSFLNNKVDQTDGRGGAIHNSIADPLPMVVDHSLFTLNQVNAGANGMGAAIFTNDSIFVRASSFIANDANGGKGGAIASRTLNADPSAGPPPRVGALIVNSTIHGNKADKGAGIHSFSDNATRDIRLINVTLDGNTAATAGGGIFTEQISGGTATTTLLNTIISNNTANGVGENCSSPQSVLVTNTIANLQWPGTTCASNTPITSGDPKLNPPFINLPDILTLTMSLNAGSAASNNGDNSTCTDPLTVMAFDQRSLVVPVRAIPALRGGANCDIGAYESSNVPGYGSAPSPLSVIAISTVQGVPGNSNVVISETGSDDLIISSYSLIGAPEITVAPPSAPFTIPDASGQTKTLTLTCLSPVPGPLFSATLTVNHNAPGSPATYTVNCTVSGVPDLVINKAHAGNFTQGQIGAQYTITVTNIGNAPTDGSAVTVTDAVPAGLTATAIGGTGWVCTQPGGPCTRSDALAGGFTPYPPITLTVNVQNNAPPSVTNSVTVAGGGEADATNDLAMDTTTINPGPDLTITKTHAGNFAQGQVGATYTITVTNNGGSPTDGSVVTMTDIVPAGLTATAISGGGWVCTQPAGPCTRNDVIPPAASYPAITLTVTVAGNAPASVTNNASVAGGGDVNPGNNSIGDPTTVTAGPDLSIAKTHAGNFTQGQNGATYTITVSNVGSTATSGTVTVADVLPAGLTATSINGSGWACTQPSGTCTRSDALAPASSYPAITLTVNVANNAATPITNTANVSGGGDVNAANNSIGDPTTVNPAAPDLTIAKTHVGNFAQGQVGATYSIVVTNNGTLPTDGSTVTVTDVLPAGLTATAISGSGWVCTQPSGSCTRSDALAPAASYPAITLTVNVANNATTPITNTATVSGGGETNVGNDTSGDSTIVATGPDLVIAKTHAGNFTQGQIGATYTITVTNNGGSPTNGSAVTVTDALPAGLTATSISGGGWACTQPSGPCSRSDALAGGASYPALTLTVTVANNAAASITNMATVAGGGDVVPGNNSATDVTTVNAAAPDLTITKTHAGNFMQGQTGKTYTITVSNSGTLPTSGLVTVTDALPAGLTATAIAGGAWTCTQPGGPCTRSDALAAGASYPAITLTVNVAINAAASVTNTATVAGGGETNAANDTANDPTTIDAAAPDLTITKSHAGVLARGQIGAVYTIVVTNSGTAPTDGSIVTVADVLPPGLTPSAVSAPGWSCTQPAGPCTRSDVLAPSASYPGITVVVNVDVNAAPSLTNTATVSGGGDASPANDTVSDFAVVGPAGSGSGSPIPTLDEYALLLLALLVGAMGVRTGVRRMARR